MNEQFRLIVHQLNELLQREKLMFLLYVFFYLFLEKKKYFCLAMIEIWLLFIFSI